MKCISNRMYWCFTCSMGLEAKESKELPPSPKTGGDGNMAAKRHLYHVYRVQRVVCPCLMLWCSTRTVITFITNLCHFHDIKSKKMVLVLLKMSSLLVHTNLLNLFTFHFVSFECLKSKSHLLKQHRVTLYPNV